MKDWGYNVRMELREIVSETDWQTIGIIFAIIFGGAGVWLGISNRRREKEKEQRKVEKEQPNLKIDIEKSHFVNTTELERNDRGEVINYPINNVCTFIGITLGVTNESTRTNTISAIEVEITNYKISRYIPNDGEYKIVHKVKKGKNKWEVNKKAYFESRSMEWPYKPEEITSGRFKRYSRVFEIEDGPIDEDDIIEMEIIVRDAFRKTYTRKTTLKYQEEAN